MRNDFRSTGVRSQRSKNSSEARVFGSLNVQETFMPPDNPAKKGFDSSTSTVREAMEKGTEAAQQATKSAEQSYSSAAEGLYFFNSKLMEMAHANMMSAVSFFGELTSTKGPTGAFELWSRHIQSDLQRLTEQSQELAMLGQRLGSASSAPLRQDLDQTIRRAS